MSYVVSKTVGPGNPETGLPNAQPGSVEWQTLYRAAKDPRLELDDRRAAARAEVERAEAELQAAQAETIEKNAPPVGFFVVSKADGDATASISCGLPVGDRLHLIRERDVLTVRTFGFVATAMPAKGGPAST